MPSSWPQPAPPVDWDTLLTEPNWSSLLPEEQPFRELARAIGTAPNGARRGSAYYRLAEAIRSMPHRAGDAALADAAAFSYLEAHRQLPLAAEYLNLGVVLMEARRPAAARAAFEMTISLRPDEASVAAPAYRNLALLPDAPSLSLLDHASRLDPSSAPIAAALGHAYRVKAKAEASSGTEDSPGGDGESLGLAIRYLERARRLEARAPPHGGPANGSTAVTGAATSHALGEALLAARRSHEAMPLLRHAAGVVPSSPVYRYQAGRALMASYSMHEAASELEAALALQPLFPIASERNDRSLDSAAVERRAMAEAFVWRHRAWRYLDEERKGAAASPQRGPRLRDCGAGAASEASGGGGGGGGGENGGEDGGGAGGGAEDGQLAAAEAAVPATRDGECPVVWAGSEEEAQAAMALHLARGTPVLLRNLSASWGRGAARTLSPWREAAGGLLDNAIVKVSIVHADDEGSLHINRIFPLPPASDGGAISPDLRLWLEERGVRHALQRPLSQRLPFSHFQTLLRATASETARTAANGSNATGAEGCERCYIKQLPLDLYLPPILRHLRPTPLRASDGRDHPLGAAFLWHGAGGTTTDLHTDRRPNLIVPLWGEKEVYVLPPGHTASPAPAGVARATISARGEAARGEAANNLVGEPVPMLDLTSLSSPGQREPADADWPADQTQAKLDMRAHYLRSHADVWAELRRAKPGSADGSGACRFRVRPPDALFLPPRWLHAVETRADSHCRVASAVNFFYDDPPPPA